MIISRTSPSGGRDCTNQRFSWCFTEPGNTGLGIRSREGVGEGVTCMRNGRRMLIKEQAVLINTPLFERVCVCSWGEKKENISVRTISFIINHSYLPIIFLIIPSIISSQVEADICIPNQPRHIYVHHQVRKSFHTFIIESNHRFTCLTSCLASSIHRLATQEH